MKNLLIGVAVFLGTLSSYAGISDSLCEEFGSDAFKECKKGQYETPRSIPKFLCEERCQKMFDFYSCMERCEAGPYGVKLISHEACADYEVGTKIYEACMTGDLDEELLGSRSIPRNLCEEFGPMGSNAYEACMNGAYDKPMSMPTHLCAKKYGYGTKQYEICIDGQKMKPASVPRDQCSKQFGYDTFAYRQCMEGAYDKPLASFEGDCYELKGLARIKCLMIMK